MTTTTWPRPMLLLVFALLPMVASCGTLTPHENFKSLMAHNVGSSIDNPNVLGSTNPEYLIDSKRLENGNIENQYRGRDSCRKFFEFDPETRIIVAWRYEGTDEDCAIIP